MASVVATLTKEYASMTAEEKEEQEIQFEKMSQVAKERLLNLSPEERAVALSKIKAMEQAVLNQKQPSLLTHLSEAPVGDPEIDACEKILAAIRSGDPEKLKSQLALLERNVNSSVQAPGDAESHPILHWAALNDQKNIISYLGSQKVNLNAKNPRGEVALHWACLNGNIQAVHVLIQLGCDITVADARGYSGMHHAAQFGHTVVMAQLLRKGVRVNVRDNSGRTSLHWAAYKGHGGAIQWLLAHGADLQAKDFEDCLPIHWASLQGLKPTCRLLVEQGSMPYLHFKDRTGGTPKELAREKQNRYEPKSYEFMQFKDTADFLESCEKNKKLPRTMQSTMKNHPTWYAWPVLAPLGWWQYQTVVFPATSHHTILTLMFVVFYWAEWVAWAMLQRSDPGSLVLVPSLTKVNSNKVSSEKDGVVIEMNTDDLRARALNTTTFGASLHRELYDEVLDNGLLVPVCTTCEIVKPLRSKHDRFSDRCISRFDHFCPFMGVAVGEENYRIFFFSMFHAMICMWTWVVLVYYYTRDYDKNQSTWANFCELFYWQLFAMLYLPIAIYSAVMVGQHLVFIKKNLTTNEIMNRARIAYLQNKQNPYDRGMVSNFLEFFGILDPIRINTRDFYSREFQGERIVVSSSSHGHSHGGKECHGH